MNKLRIALLFGGDGISKAKNRKELMEENGIPMRKLLDQLISLALER